jgi:hypothetical protein
MSESKIGQTVCKHNSHAPLMCDKCRIETLQSESTKLRAKVDVLKKALGDLLSIEGIGWMNQRESNLIIDRARAALEEIKE